MVKDSFKQKAVELRKKGFSYREILVQVPVAKSTLSLWLKCVGLSKPQMQVLTRRRLVAALRGAQKRKQQRLQVSAKIKREAMTEIGVLNEKAFWLVGAALYWAEGSKQKEHNVATGVIFSNSDFQMIKFFYVWLTKICHVKKDDIYFEIYLHEGCDVEKIKKFWSRILKVAKSNFIKIRYKPNKFKTYRKNTGNEYHGLVRILVRNSANLNRKIMGWAEGVYTQFTN